jgi:hypothetical protein
MCHPKCLCSKQRNPRVFPLTRYPIACGHVAVRRVHKRAVELPLARTAPKARGRPQNLSPGPSLLRRQALRITKMRDIANNAMPRIRPRPNSRHSVANRDCLRPEVPFNSSFDSPLQGDRIRLSALTGGINHTFDDCQDVEGHNRLVCRARRPRAAE